MNSVSYENDILSDGDIASIAENNTNNKNTVVSIETNLSINTDTKDDEKHIDKGGFDTIDSSHINIVSESLIDSDTKVTDKRDDLQSIVDNVETIPVAANKVDTAETPSSKQTPKFMEAEQPFDNNNHKIKNDSYNDTVQSNVENDPDIAADVDDVRLTKHNVLSTNALISDQNKVEENIEIRTIAELHSANSNVPVGDIKYELPNVTPSSPKENDTTSLPSDIDVIVLQDEFVDVGTEKTDGKPSLEIKPNETVLNDGGTIDSTLSSPDDDTSEGRIKKKRKSFRKRLRRTASRRTASCKVS